MCHVYSCSVLLWLTTYSNPVYKHLIYDTHACVLIAIYKVVKQKDWGKNYTKSAETESNGYKKMKWPFSK